MKRKQRFLYINGFLLKNKRNHQIRRHRVCRQFSISFLFMTVIKRPGNVNNQFGISIYSQPSQFDKKKKNAFIENGNYCKKPSVARLLCSMFYFVFSSNGFTVLICGPSRRSVPFFTVLIVSFMLEEACCKVLLARRTFI